MKSGTELAIKTALAISFVVLVLFMIYSFGGETPFTVVNIDGKTEVRAGETQEYFIDLRTVDPAQFTTATHYRQQFGSWQLVDMNSSIISKGTTRIIDNGVYSGYVSIKVPPKRKEFNLVINIKEYQFSAAEEGGEYLRDNGTIRTEQIFPIKVMACSEHADCKAENTCLGQFGYCREGICEVQGDCVACVQDSDCIGAEGATGKLICQNYHCTPYKEPTFQEGAQQQFHELFDQPITEPGPVKSGETPQPKPAPDLLRGATIVLLIILVYFIFMLRSRRR
jgi:hypothetical protein